MMKYRDFIANVEVDDDAGIIFGRVINTRSVITFQGKSVEEARQAFQDSIEDYLEFCKERGVSPEKPYSGTFLVRTTPERHRELASRAAAQGISFNKFVDSALAGKLRATSGNVIRSTDFKKKRSTTKT